MRAELILSIMLMPFLAFASGSITVQPKINGPASFIFERPASSAIRDGFTLIQPAEKSMTLQILAEGYGRCDGKNLTPEVATFPLAFSLDNREIECGQIVYLDKKPVQNTVIVRINQKLNQYDLNGFLHKTPSPRFQIGSLNVAVAGVGVEKYPVWFETILLQEDSPLLSASFDKAALNFGKVVELQDARDSARLTISKTPQAESIALPYVLTLESSQQQNDSYFLRVASGTKLIPYQVYISGQEILPGGAYHHQIPAGKITSDILNLEFFLPGKNLRGLAAGVRLQDTLTAVITPES